MSRRTNPKISVLMSVYNGESFLAQSIESILGQSVTDFEFIIVDDGSTDLSPKILGDYQNRDRRINSIRNVENKGLSYSLNRALRIAHGEFYARQDADDISHPRRFLWQMDYLKRHPDISVAGTWIKKINGGGEEIGEWKPWVDRMLILFSLFNAPSIAHPSVMFRNEVFAGNLHYDENLKFAQDISLWQNLGFQFGLANIPQFLYFRRVHEKMVGRLEKLLQESLALTQIIQFNRLKLDIDLSPAQLSRMRNLLSGSGSSADDFAKAREDLQMQFGRFQELVGGHKRFSWTTKVKWKMILNKLWWKSKLGGFK